jgi:hypothetical protein
MFFFAIRIAQYYTTDFKILLLRYGPKKGIMPKLHSSSAMLMLAFLVHSVGNNFGLPFSGEYKVTLK